MLNTNLLFMDESFSYDKNKKNITFGSLTGIMVPANLVITLLANIYNLFADVLSSELEPNVINLKLFDDLLHGSNFMPAYNDSIKQIMLNGLVEVIVKNNIN